VTCKICAVLCVLGLLVALICSSPKAGVVVNEVMANEPGGYVTLEWIEVYNDSLAAASIVGYQLKVGDKWIELPDNVWLDAGEYYIVCRKRVSDISSPGFEGLWGDSSGVWGDTPEESRLQTPYVAQFSLTNSGGSVELYDPLGILISELTWIESGQDGFSWERTSPQSLEIAQSVDLGGSTPGFINSHTPVPNDLALESVDVVPDNGQVAITFTVANCGLNVISGSQLLLCLDVGEGLGVFADTIDTIDIAEIEPRATFVTMRKYSFNGIYVDLSAYLPDDDRSRNNRFDFVATGADFPPIILSELLANPGTPLETEWVEIKNRLYEPFDIAGWKLGDSLSLHSIVETNLLLEPGEYVVLAKDTIAFLEFYYGFDKTCLQLDRWPAFNNGYDVVRLIDNYGFGSDRFVYTRVFDDNFTWGRSEEPGRDGEWGRSENMGGSPGGANSVLYEPRGSNLVVTIEPNVFSPDGDGFEDVAVITVEEVPTEAELTMRVYDRQGRAVRTIVDSEGLLRSSYTWDGRSDSGHRLPIGIYVLYLEATGGGSIKKPIVIAR